MARRKKEFSSSVVDIGIVSATEEVVVEVEPGPVDAVPSVEPETVDADTTTSEVSPEPVAGVGGQYKEIGGGKRIPV